ncbi:uncharacterized protein LOC109852127 [Pseudomyrmex gracilis]|uniref:uncharacterized protein LOC109852127 n=1 Tax=Pseudomyrmex gracilis TaxID=219809 RepID=UPI000995CAEB|nr:uncharacterized protein LOC109852127 [Pseudomyrmex gracilis]
MRLCDFLFYTMLISLVRCFPTWQPIRRTQGLLIVRLSPMSTTWQDVTNAWRTVHNPALKAPQVQIYMLKGHVSPDQNWAYSNEYKYSNQHYEEIAAKKPSTTDYKITKTPDSGNRVDVEKNKGNPSFESRNIIDPPIHCADGYAPDSNNICRERLE